MRSYLLDAVMSKRCEVEEVWSDCHRTYCQQHKKCAVAAQSEPCPPLAAPLHLKEVLTLLNTFRARQMFSDTEEDKLLAERLIGVITELEKVVAPIPPEGSKP